MNQVAFTMSIPKVREVMQGNPGALTVLVRLQHRSRWIEMVEWLKDNGYCGSLLWVLFKDIFHQDLYAMGDFIVLMMNSKHYRAVKHGTQFLRVPQSLL